MTLKLFSLSKNVNFNLSNVLFRVLNSSRICSWLFENEAIPITPQIRTFCSSLKFSSLRIASASSKESPNLVSSFAIKNCNGKIPSEIKFQNEDLIILNKYNDNLDKIRLKIDEQNINFYIDYIINSLFEANKYFNDQEPWKKKNEPQRLNTIVYTALEIIRKISFLLYPIIPDSSLKALKIFNLSQQDIKLQTISNNEFLTKGMNINKIEILFKKIEKKDD